MNYYALFYEVVDNFVARRAPFRQEHLRLANEARERGEIVFAGALAEPAAALIVFHVDDKTKVESFAHKDPYVINGLVKKWEARLWNVVVGNEPRSSTKLSTTLSPAALPSARSICASQTRLAHVAKLFLPARLPNPPTAP